MIKMKVKRNFARQRKVSGSGAEKTASVGNLKKMMLTPPQEKITGDRRGPQSQLII